MNGSFIENQVIQTPDQTLVAITPLQREDSTLIGYLYIKVDTKQAYQQRGIEISIFLVGSLICIALTFFIIIISFQRPLFKPLGQLLDVVKRVSSGDLNARLEGSFSEDEIGTLQRGVMSMTNRLVETITQLDHNVSELKLATVKANESARIKGEFLATMSHELRTPLNAIEGFTSIMLSNMGIELPARAKGMIERISANSKRLLSLINDFLDLSRIESGRIDLISTPIRLDTMVNYWASQVTSLAATKKLALDVQVDSTLPPVIMGDEEALTKIAINLLGNAIKFMQSGSVTDTFKLLNGN